MLAQWSSKSRYCRSHLEPQATTTSHNLFALHQSLRSVGISAHVWMKSGAKNRTKVHNCTQALVRGQETRRDPTYAYALCLLGVTHLDLPRAEFHAGHAVRGFSLHQVLRLRFESALHSRVPSCRRLNWCIILQHITIFLQEKRVYLLS